MLPTAGSACFLGFVNSLNSMVAGISALPGASVQKQLLLLLSQDAVPHDLYGLVDEIAAGGGNSHLFSLYLLWLFVVVVAKFSTCSSAEDPTRIHQHRLVTIIDGILILPTLHNAYILLFMKFLVNLILPPIMELYLKKVANFNDIHQYSGRAVNS